MLQLPQNISIFVYTLACDMRKQFDGLAGMVQSSMNRDPRSGDMFVFRNKRADMVKILFFDSQGLCVFAKRRDKGRFSWLASDDSASIKITPQQLAELIQDANIRRAA